MADITTALAVKPLYMEAAVADTDIVYGGLDFRRLIGAVYNTPGPVQYEHFRILQRAAGANWSVDIEPGLAIVPGLTTNEKYLVFLSSTLNIPVTTLNTAPAATRTHKVFLAVYDKLYAGASYNASIFIGEDTGSGAPNPTGSAVGYHQLGTFGISPAQVSVATANIINLFTSAGFDQTWTNLTLAAGYVAGDALRPPAWRRIGKRVEYRGLVKKSVGPIPNAGTLFTAPIQVRPSSEVQNPIAFSQGVDGLVRCGYGRQFDNGSGAAFVVYFTPGPAGTSPDEVSLDGYNFDID